MATKKVPQGSGTSKRRVERTIFAAEVQCSAERKALAKLPELAQRAALAAMHLETASLAQVIAAIEVLARRDELWNNGSYESIDICLMLIRGSLTRVRSDIEPRAKEKSALRKRQARSMVARANEAEVQHG